MIQIRIPCRSFFSSCSMVSSMHIHLCFRSFLSRWLTPYTHHSPGLKDEWSCGPPQSRWSFVLSVVRLLRANLVSFRSPSTLRDNEALPQLLDVLQKLVLSPFGDEVTPVGMVRFWPLANYQGASIPLLILVSTSFCGG